MQKICEKITQIDMKRDSLTKKLLNLKRDRLVEKLLYLKHVIIW